MKPLSLLFLLCIASCAPDQQVLEERRVMDVLSADFDAPTRETTPPVSKLEYEAIYLVPCDWTNWSKKPLDAVRISGVGMRRSPAWDLDGSRIAYVDQSKGFHSGSIVVLDLSNNRRTVYEDVGAAGVGNNLSWDAAGRTIAFINSKSQVVLLDLRTKGTSALSVSNVTSLALSPDGSMVCFVAEEKNEDDEVTAAAVSILDIDSGVVRAIHSSTGGPTFSIDHTLRWYPNGKSFTFDLYRLSDTGQLMTRTLRHNLTTGKTVPYTDFEKGRPYRQDRRFWGTR